MNKTVVVLLALLCISVGLDLYLFGNLTQLMKEEEIPVIPISTEEEIITLDISSNYDLHKGEGGGRMLRLNWGGFTYKGNLWINVWFVDDPNYVILIITQFDETHQLRYYGWADYYELHILAYTDTQLNFTLTEINQSEW